MLNFRSGKEFSLSLEEFFAEKLFLLYPFIAIFEKKAFSLQIVKLLKVIKMSKKLFLRGSQSQRREVITALFAAHTVFTARYLYEAYGIPYAVTTALRRGEPVTERYLFRFLCAVLDDTQEAAHADDAPLLFAIMAFVSAYRLKM